ncbi:hypothetical protein SVIOM342S_01268 [Streptomyces violaceorubidus]
MPSSTCTTYVSVRSLPPTRSPPPPAVAKVPGPDDGIESGSGFSSVPFPSSSVFSCCSSFSSSVSVSFFSFAGEAVDPSFGFSSVPPARGDPGPGADEDASAVSVEPPEDSVAPLRARPPASTRTAPAASPGHSRRDRPPRRRRERLPRRRRPVAEDGGGVGRRRSFMITKRAPGV